MKLLFIASMLFSSLALSDDIQQLPFVATPEHQDVFQTIEIEDDWGDVEVDEIQSIINEMNGERSTRGKAERFARRYQARMGQTTYTALEGLLKFTYITLKAKGHRSMAYAFRNEWRGEQRNRFKRYFYSTERAIGDYAPLSEWLAEWYDKIEGALGKPLCDLLHISDIKSLNHGIPVVFDPCYPQWEGKDFKDHFATDGIYHGVAPVVLYWVSYAACSIGTYGMGFFVLCGSLASGLESLFEYTLAGPLADKIYELACGN